MTGIRFLRENRTGTGHAGCNKTGRRQGVDVGDGAPKSAYELAMEKLKRQDEVAGVEAVELTAVQVEGIAEARRNYEARVAECRILHQSALAGAADAQVLQELEANHRRDLARFASDRDKRIERIRRGETS